MTVEGENEGHQLCRKHLVLQVTPRTWRTHSGCAKGMSRDFDVFSHDVSNTVALSRVTVGPARGTAAEKATKWSKRPVSAGEVILWSWGSPHGCCYVPRTLVTRAIHMESENLFLSPHRRAVFRMLSNWHLDSRAIEKQYKFKHVWSLALPHVWSIIEAVPRVNDNYNLQH